MPRKVKCRKVCHYPQTLEFLPQNNNAEQEPILLTVDEYEAIRLIDRRGMSQEQCAAFMHRPYQISTFARCEESTS